MDLTGNYLYDKNEKHAVFGPYLHKMHIYKVSSKEQLADMENGFSIHGKLFILAFELHQQNKISSSEKSQFKGTSPHIPDMIIDDSEELIQIYENYLREGTELTLSSSLIHLLRL